MRAAIWVLGTKLAFSQELLTAELSPQAPKLGGFVFTVDGGGFFVSIFSVSVVALAWLLGLFLRLVSKSLTQPGDLEFLIFLPHILG